GEAFVLAAPVVAADMRPDTFDHVRLGVQRVERRRVATALAPLLRLAFVRARVAAVEELAPHAAVHRRCLPSEGLPREIRTATAPADPDGCADARCAGS